MQLGTARTTLRDMLGTRGGGGTWDDTTCDLYINMAARLIWRKVLAINPGLIAVDEAITYAASATSHSLVSGGTFKVDAILAAFSVPSAGAISSTNIPTPLYPSEFSDIEVFNASEEPFINNVYRTGYKYSILALSSIAIRPIPQSAFPIVVRMVKVPTDLSAPADEIWGGALSGLHDIVVMRAAQLASAKVKEAARLWQQFELEAWSNAQESLQGTLQTPAAVRHTEASL